ncbi:hypothetical protein LCGC14_2437920, partial [marine sediment metagenome]
EIFHVASSNMSLSKANMLIKNLNKDSPPTAFSDIENKFCGYEINSDKLQALGFKYKYTLKDEFKKLEFVMQNVS